MDRAYEGDETRQLVFDLQLQPVVPPKINRLNPWEYDRELYKKRNQVERLFRRLKGFRRIFSRFEKLDAMFSAFILIALIYESSFTLTRPSGGEPVSSLEEEATSASRGCRGSRKATRWCNPGWRCRVLRYL